MIPPINFRQWIEHNRELLKPPVGNKVIWQDSEFIIMVVGGPNKRQDYHVNVSDEFFYQIEGDMNLKVIDNGIFKDIPIRQGEIFLLPGLVPHSPRRFENTIGLVMERKRMPEEEDGFEWYCEKCHAFLYKASVHVSDIEKDLPPVFDKFYSNPEHTKCKECHTHAHH